VRLVSANDTATGGGFTAAALPDQAQGFAGPNEEIDAIDRFDVVDYPPKKARPNGEVHFKIFDLKHGIISHGTVGHFTVDRRRSVDL
jgi:hypothetical protein